MKMLQWLLPKRKTEQTYAGEKSEMKAFKGSKSENIYLSLRELPLDRFITLQETNNLILLEKTEEVTASPERLEEVWSEMNIDFATKMDNGDLKSRYRLETEARVLAYRLETIYILLDLIEQEYKPEIASMLKELGFHINPDNMEKSLRNATTKAKSIILQIKKIQADVKPSAQGESNWTEILVALSDEAKYQIDPSKITVEEYIIRHKKYILRLEKYGRSDR